MQNDGVVDETRKQHGNRPDDKINSGYHDLARGPTARLMQLRGNDSYLNANAPFANKVAEELSHLSYQQYEHHSNILERNNESAQRVTPR